MSSNPNLIGLFEPSRFHEDLLDIVENARSNKDKEFPLYAVWGKVYAFLNVASFSGGCSLSTAPRVRHRRVRREKKGGRGSSGHTGGANRPLHAPLSTARAPRDGSSLVESATATGKLDSLSPLGHTLTLDFTCVSYTKDIVMEYLYGADTPVDLESELAMMSEDDTSDESDYSVEESDTTQIPDTSIYLRIPHARSNFHIVGAIKNKVVSVLADTDDTISLIGSNQASRRYLFSRYLEEIGAADKVFSDARKQVRFQLEHIFTSTEVRRVQYIFTAGLYFTTFVAQAAAEDMGIPAKPDFHFLYADESFGCLNPLLAEIWSEVITWEDPSNERS